MGKMAVVALVITLLTGLTLFWGCSSTSGDNYREIASTLNRDDYYHHDSDEWRSYFEAPEEDKKKREHK